MCATCGCSNDSGITVTDLDQVQRHSHRHDDDHRHDHDHVHDHRPGTTGIGSRITAKG